MSIGFRNNDRHPDKPENKTSKGADTKQGIQLQNSKLRTLKKLS